jgi:hypothetical protein
MYVSAQEIPQIETEIAQKGHFRMETNYARITIINNKLVFIDKLNRYSGKLLFSQ